MGISIKRAETEANARKLALRTGESLTEAIDIAIAERLERVKPTEEEMARFEKQKQELFAWLDSLGPGNGKSREEIEAEMYDEHGSPI
ncbi:MAG: hypothetical protein JWP35_2170 [Caulobacter sp.]|jgi:antitoxin VapB|nr:hypothetical protein [Caulobacter sp.]